MRLPSWPRTREAERVPVPETARLVRIQLEGAAAAAEGALLVRGDDHPFALAGDWAGGGALIGSVRWSWRTRPTTPSTYSTTSRGSSRTATTQPTTGSDPLSLPGLRGQTP